MIDLQNRYAPNSNCFGCGPANNQGLNIKSIPYGEIVIANFMPKPHHQAFPNILSGGIIGTVLDCHSNWTAAWKIMNNCNERHPPCTVTAEYKIKLLYPCPTKNQVKLVAKIKKSDKKKAFISAELIAENRVCATCEGVFISVKEGHPAYNRW
ncbi:MAG: thioesterase [Candidatus Marinimicrobia bacterium]|nr:thioesterase [Candidatus Neomarinimicrobiota bacterium]|tara:strand:- start:6532 stop:6990 length:459 start_codon:yes stop_codon:yes gene_type:complete